MAAQPCKLELLQLQPAFLNCQEACPYDTELTQGYGGSSRASSRAWPQGYSSFTGVKPTLATSRGRAWACTCSWAWVKHTSQKATGPEPEGYGEAER